MAINPHDPRPQARIRTVKDSNTVEPVGPYVDRAFTTRNIDQVASTVLPPFSGSKTLGNIRRYYAEDRLEEIDQVSAATDNVDVQPLPNAGNSWPIEEVAGFSRAKDVYRNGGVIGQDSFLQNQGE